MGHLPTKQKNSLVASAAVLNARKIGNHYTDHADWQDEAWRLFDVTGELRYAMQYEASAVSRANLVAARRNPDPNGDPIVLPDTHPAQQLVRQFLGGTDAQTDALARISTLVSVTGVAYVVALEDEDDEDGAMWHVLSNDEVKYDNGRWKFKLLDMWMEKDKESAVVIRVWTSHPRRWWQADSQVRGLLPVLRELEGLTKHVSATIDSRLAGAGVLFVPQEMTFVTNRDDLEDGDDPFIVELIESMIAPVVDRDVASALVPLVVKAPGELIGNIQHLTFSTPFDEKTIELRDEAIRRLALGLNIPPEILLGTGGMNHWSAWQVEDSTIKLHIEPKLRLLVNAFTKGFLNPAMQALRDDGVTFPWDTDDIFVWYDTTDIKLRPNRSEDASTLHDRMLITDMARRKASGFDEDAAPNPGSDEWVLMLLRHAVLEQPQYVETLLPVIGELLDIPMLANMVLPDLDNSEQGNGDTPNPDADTSGTPDEDQTGRERNPPAEVA